MSLNKSDIEKFGENIVIIDNADLNFVTEVEREAKSKMLYDNASKNDIPTFLEMHGEYIFLNENNFKNHDNDNEIDPETGLSKGTLNYVIKRREISDFIQKNSNISRK